MKSPVSWGLIIGAAPIAIPFILWPIWWLAGCEPRGQAVFCANAQWYSDIALKIVSLPWLMFISIPVGLVLILFGFFHHQAAKSDP